MKMPPQSRAAVGVLLVGLTFLLYHYVFVVRKEGQQYKLHDYKDVGNNCTQQHTVNRPSGPSLKRILLVTYGRSGSTFTSYILKETPGTFFFFEPLRPLLVKNTGGVGTIMSYEALGGRYWPVQEVAVSQLTGYEQKAVTLLDQLFRCDIGNFPVTDYLSTHFLLHGNVSKVTQCLQPMVKAEGYLNLSHYLQCLLDFWASCQAATTRLFKLIRLPARALSPLLQKHADLRVVYLARDPRAILSSQRALFGAAPRAKDFCRMVEDDAAHIRLLQETFPGRVVALRYEDVASDPLIYTRRLYSALQLPLTSDVESKVRKMTSGGGRNSSSSSNEGAYSIFRSDPRKSSSAWRTKISFSSVREDDGVCVGAYQWLGYREALNESVLRDLGQSLTAPFGRLGFL